MKVSDEELLRRIANRDRDAFEAFYEEYAPRIFGFLVKRLRYRHEAEEVLQETFFQVWTQANRYSPDRATPGVWLFLIARSRTVDYLRRTQRAPEKSSPMETPRMEVSQFHEPFDELERLENKNRVHAALSRLSEAQRESLYLAFYHGWTQERIAERQGVPLGTVKSRIRIGLRRLRELLVKKDEDSPHEA